MSTAILSIALMGSLTGHITSKNLLSESAETEIALERLRSEMAQVSSQDIATILAGNTVGNTTTLDPHDSLLDAAQLSFTTPGYAAGDPAPSTLNLRLDLSWESRSGRARSMNIICAAR